MKQPKLPSLQRFILIALYEGSWIEQGLIGENLHFSLVHERNHKGRQLNARSVKTLQKNKWIAVTRTAFQLRKWGISKAGEDRLYAWRDRSEKLKLARAYMRDNPTHTSPA